VRTPSGAAPPPSVAETARLAGGGGSKAACNLGLTIGFGALGLLLVIVTRGRLGYDRSKREEPGPAPGATGG